MQHVRFQFCLASSQELSWPDTEICSVIGWGSILIRPKIPKTTMTTTFNLSDLLVVNNVYWLVVENPQLKKIRVRQLGG